MQFEQGVVSFCGADLIAFIVMLKKILCTLQSTEMKLDGSQNNWKNVNSTF